MKNRLYKILKPIRETQSIRGVELPVGLEFRQLVVTGPPGAGKTYYINQIRGWPNEGYLDLMKRGWWKDQSLIYRPREIHLGIPYKGFAESLTVFDQEWLDAPPESLEIDYSRIRIPPQAGSLFGTNWRDRYIFEFIIPDAELIYERRRNRQKDGYFPVDANLSMAIVSRQIEEYSAVALYLHRAGLNVYIRKTLEQPPMLISEKGTGALPPWAVADIIPRTNLKSLEGWKELFSKQGKVPWFSVNSKIQILTEAGRISHDGKSFDMIIGRCHLRIAPEIPLGASKRYLRHHKNWIIRKPETCSDRKLRGFVRLNKGETILLGRANKDYDNLFDFKKDVAKRHVSITNLKGDLFIKPLDPDKPVRIVRLDNEDNREQIDATRIASMLEALSLLGGSVSMLDKRSALALILEVNEILAEEPYRPRDAGGLPGGLLEIPDEPTPIIVGDLHGMVDNLLKILTENCLIQALQDKSVILCILGDAVHSENAQEMENMDSSILMMDLILSLKRRFPANVFYLRGNHDDFDPELSKNGIPQGLLMKRALEKYRGKAFVEAMQTFYDRLPVMIVSPSLIAIHASPPRVGTTREQIINIRENKTIADELLKNRLKRPHYLSGYGKKEIKALRQILDAEKSTPVIVGHTPLDPFGTIWQNVGSIKNHHIIYSSHQNGPGLFVRIRGKMIPLSYPYEPLVRLINKMKRSP